MNLLRRIPIVVALAGLLAAPGPGAAQVQEPRLAGLRDVSTLQISVGTFPNRDPAAPCVLERGALESHAVELLRSAGLRTLTLAEVLERNRQDGEAIARALEAQRRGERLPGPNSEEVRQRGASIEFMRTLPGLMVLFATAPVVGGAGPAACALTVSAMFRVYPAEAPTIGATGHRVFAGMLLWETPPRVYAAPEPELAALALERLEATVNAFVAAWRGANGR